ncbi:two-component sensor histidine kinase [Mycolicibacterium sp. 018/SC-01/001]|uniref:sensor histidine kinase n=1 Tax=Mycolicibacterium sp. 018/SC-01/001 TaxID=2592069 RepID=UPI0011804704|nr:histidine kinase [Mycolicibacterium sp. 018/SC-01/001]TRW88775.1 two-component sensor histidine kinase [Mycolicibacterium sp. 018/SC-01/001]
MVDALRQRVRVYAARKAEDMPGGYTWPFVISVEGTMVVVSVIAALQRPGSHWWLAVIAILLAVLPDIAFFFTDERVPVAVEAATTWLAWLASTALFLFGFPTPISGDFAPLLLSLLTGMIGAFTSARTSLAVALSAAALVGAAVWAGQIDTPWLYLTFIAIGLLVGWLMRIQQELLLEQRRAQAKLAQHAAADERRRIAREVHDVIAHSLSVTLLHVTGARRDLQVDRDVDEAVTSLEQAERLGRQAMADIRRTVGLLDDATGATAPEPGVDDLAALVEDFVRAGLQVSLRITGGTGRISAAEGLALYRIAQESLANVAKHAPEAATSVSLDVGGAAAVLTIANRVPVLVAGGGVGREGLEGRGMRGMRQRIELLGGTFDAGPDGQLWSVRAQIPVDGRSGCLLRGGGQ